MFADIVHILCFIFLSLRQKPAIFATSLVRGRQWYIAGLYIVRRFEQYVKALDFVDILGKPPNGGFFVYPYCSAM